jgi:hypothetical protein
MCVCVSPPIVAKATVTFSMRFVLYQRKIGDYFFPELFVISNEMEPVV